MLDFKPWNLKWKILKWIFCIYFKCSENCDHENEIFLLKSQIWKYVDIFHKRINFVVKRLFSNIIFIIISQMSQNCKFLTENYKNILSENIKFTQHSDAKVIKFTILSDFNILSWNNKLFKWKVNFTKSRVLTKTINKWL